MPWTPGDAWPGTSGGAAHPAWSGYIRLFLQAQIAAGTTFHVGSHLNDKLNDGNVLGQAGGFDGDTDTPTLWVDLSCAATDVEIDLGSSTAAGILSKPEAGTLMASFHDPTGALDPANPDTPYQYQGHTRLVPGVPVRAWCEVIDDPFASVPAVNLHPLFYGTADRWSEPWTTDESRRTAHLVATDPTKLFVKFNKPGLTTPVGAGDTVLNRINRIADNYDWPGSITQWGLSTTTLQATTLAQSGWELVNRVLDDELGFGFFLPSTPTDPPTGAFIIIARPIWTNEQDPQIEIGCRPGMFDIAVDVTVAAFDAQLRNTVYAARTGGTQQTAANATSVDRWGLQSLERTDLGLADDTQAADWAQTIVDLYAFPQTALDRIVVRPDAAGEPWAAWDNVVSRTLVLSLVRVVWDSAGYTVNVGARIVGLTHRISPDAWEVEWRTVPGRLTNAELAFHIGSHPHDALDAGWILT